MRVLIVEDMPERVRFLSDLYGLQETIVCDNVGDAIMTLETRNSDLLLLDYDLRGEEKGSEIARYVAETNKDLLVVVHSDNKSGTKAILGNLATAVILPITTQVNNSAVSARLKVFLNRPLSVNDVPDFERLLRSLAAMSLV